MKEDRESNCTDTQNGIGNMIVITTSVYISFISKTVQEIIVITNLCGICKVTVTP